MLYIALVLFFSPPFSLPRRNVLSHLCMAEEIFPITLSFKRNTSLPVLSLLKGKKKPWDLHPSFKGKSWRLTPVTPEFTHSTAVPLQPSLQAVSDYCAESVPYVSYRYLLGCHFQSFYRSCQCLLWEALPWELPSFCPSNLNLPLEKLRLDSCFNYNKTCIVIFLLSKF